MKKIKTKQYFGLTVKDEKKPKVRIEDIPYDGIEPTKIYGILRPGKDDTNWRLLDIKGQSHLFTLSRTERDIIRRLKLSCKRCKEVRISVKHGRLMGLTFNEYGDGRIR